MRLDELNSIINNYPYAFDSNRAFTFIEFIKQLGETNADATFASLYKDYLTKWAEVTTIDVDMTKEEYVRQRMLDILRSITLTYSSYEEQQFIASIDWSNMEEIKMSIPLFVRKIREICEFYRKRRNDIPTIVKRNSMKGSYRSIEEIIYNTIVDFVFNNRHLQPQMAELKQNLMVSIEKYVDTYSEYFDIPREKNLRVEKEREYMIEANMNDIDYRNYLEVKEIVNEILFTGEVYLEDIGLMASLALDLTQECAGEMLELKNQLLSDATVNQIPVTEQINLRRKFYEKFLGCDLYYMYVTPNMDIQVDLLCTAKNPSGNLLNCDTADRAVTQNEELELLSHIGLFFKPDKTSILKVNAKDFAWSVNKDKIEADTIYVFPDPTKYGNIGNNKNPDYPLIMEYKMDYDIRNLSSGAANDDPFILLDELGWNSYYSKQQNIFKVTDNKNFDYSFTSLANIGYIHNYQTDIYSNEFALYKGYSEIWMVDENGNPYIDHVEIPDKFSPHFDSVDTLQDYENNSKYIMINGGYFENPFYPGSYKTNADGTKTYMPGRPFDYVKQKTIDDYYHWSGIELGDPPIVTPNMLFDGLDFQNFGDTKDIKYIDHFMYTGTPEGHALVGDGAIGDIEPEFYTQFLTDYSTEEIPIIEVNKSFLDIQGDEGALYIKNNIKLERRPQSLSDTFYWLPEDLKVKKVINFWVKKGVLIYETSTNFVFAPYKYENGEIINNLSLNELLVIPKENILYSDLLWNEKEQMFYITIFNKYTSTHGLFTLVPMIYCFNPIEYTFTPIVSAWDFIPSVTDEFKKIDKMYYFDNDKYHAVQAKILEIIATPAKIYDDVFFSSNYNLENFNYPYEENVDFGHIIFSYNNNLNLYLLAYLINDNNGINSIYEHKFKATNTQTFNNTIVTNIYSLLDYNTTFNVYNENIDSGITTDKNKQFFFRQIG